MAKLIGSEWCMAMGDDSVEGWVDGAKEKYLALGHTCKDYIACETSISETGPKLEKFNFCSHEIGETHCYLTNWEKALFRFLHSQNPQLRELESELSGSPKWPAIYRYLRRVGLAPDKTNGQERSSSKGEERKEEDSFFEYYHPQFSSGCGWVSDLL